MPTYEYQCQECGERLEIFQKFTDKPLRLHPMCGGRLQKVFHPSGVVFKGSGYYVTDSRSNGGTKSSRDTDSKTDTKSDSKTGDSKSDKKPTGDKAGSQSKTGSAAAKSDD